VREDLEAEVARQEAVLKQHVAELERRLANPPLEPVRYEDDDD
jgi:hypothetical protein